MREGYSFRAVQLRRLVAEFVEEPTPERVGLIRKLSEESEITLEEIGFEEGFVMKVMRKYFLEKAKVFLEKLRRQCREEDAHYVLLYVNAAEAEMKDIGITEREFESMMRNAILKDAYEAMTALREGDASKYLYVVEVLQHAGIAIEALGINREQLDELHVQACLRNLPG